MLKTFISVVKNKKLMKSILITLGVLALFRVGTLITIPSVNLNNKADNTGFLDVLNLLGGGGMKRVSIFAMGVSPYIMTSIVVQMFASSGLIKPLTRWQKSGAIGKKKMEMTTRAASILLAIPQSFATINVLKTAGMIDLNLFTTKDWFFIITIIVAGSYIAIFLADLITKFGIGNGMSLIILTGIVARVPYNLQTVYTTLVGGGTAGSSIFLALIYFIGYMLMYGVLIFIVIIIFTSVRKIPMQTTGAGMASNEEQVSYFPIKVNPPGVIPVIFGSMLFWLPVQIITLIPNYEIKPAYWFLTEFWTLKTWTGIMVYIGLILFFGIGYTFIQYDPEELAKNFKQGSRFIPGVRPGEETRRYLQRTLMCLALIGTPLLAIIAILPNLVGMYTPIPNTVAFGGTGMILIVNILTDTSKILKASITTGEYSDKVKKIVKNDNTTSRSISIW